MDGKNFRHEYKHSVTEFDLAGMRRRLGMIARKDKHAHEDGLYTVRSLYFDNCYDKALQEKIAGMEKREKFRIRYYDRDTSFIRLEKKSRIYGLCLKESCALNRDEVSKILNQDTAWMAPDPRELVNELWAKMQFQVLRPRHIVLYEREAYVYTPGDVRVTIDSNIRGEADISRFFWPDEGEQSAAADSILEVKWGAFLPQIIRDIVQMNTVMSGSFSKYAAARLTVL